MPTFKDFLTVSQAARMLGVDPMTLRRWDRARKLLAKRHPFNNYRLYARREIEELMKNLPRNRLEGQMSR
ncbi:MAG: MerR family DNA-binding transcriptional regulator [Elusimicrobia bacterium]|nr:MerR family DNA-binding transcriptional regulator [Elusimicrobiota bacterium]